MYKSVNQPKPSQLKKGKFKMNELIKINYENADRPTVMGRELHEALEVKTKYADWFKRMCEYGFAENTDFVAISQKRETAQGNETTYNDHQLTIEMAKEICMIQRTDKGKQCRQYFIELEKAWNTPEMVMGRALKIAQNQIDSLKYVNAQLETSVAVKDQQISELKPKASYYDVVLNCPDLLSTTKIAKDYGKSAVWLNSYLHDKKIQYKQGGVWLLYQNYAQCGYTSTKTHNYNGDDGIQHAKVHTYWTQKGRLFIYETLKSDGILPLVEYKQSA